ncbi:MAG: AI-2E family transporter [Oscillospiraceae bacterium]
MNNDKSSFKRTALLIAFGVFFYWILQHYTDVLGFGGYIVAILNPFIIGLAMAYVLNIPMRAIERLLFKNHPGKLARALSLVITIILVIGVLLFVIFMVLPELVSTIALLIRSMPGYISQLQKSLAPFEEYIPMLNDFLSDLNIDWKSITGDIVTFLQSGAGAIFSSALGVASSVVNGTVTFFVSIIFSCYILLDKEHLGAQLTGICRAYLPEKRYKKLRKFSAMADHIFSHFIAGQGTEALVIATIFVVVLWVGGFNYSLLIGVLVGAMSLIPIFGAFIACVVGAILILISQGLWRALAFVIVFLVVQQIDGNMIYPHIVGNSIGLPPIWVLVAVSLGGSIAGMGGMLIFIPICSVVYTLVHQNASKRLKKKGIRSPVIEMNEAAETSRALRREGRKKAPPSSTSSLGEVTNTLPVEEDNTIDNLKKDIEATELEEEFADDEPLDVTSLLPLVPPKPTLLQKILRRFKKGDNKKEDE